MVEHFPRWLGALPPIDPRRGYSKLTTVQEEFTPTFEHSSPTFGHGTSLPGCFTTDILLPHGPCGEQGGHDHLQGGPARPNYSK